jgi:hypothetical protein
VRRLTGLMKSVCALGIRSPQKSCRSLCELHTCVRRTCDGHDTHPRKLGSVQESWSWSGALPVFRKQIPLVLLGRCSCLGRTSCCLSFLPWVHRICTLISLSCGRNIGTRTWASSCVLLMDSRAFDFFFFGGEVVSRFAVD